MRKLIDYILENISLKQLAGSEQKEYDDYIITTYWPNDNDNDKQYIKMNKNTLFAFLNDGYNAAGLGDFKSCYDSRHLARNASCVRICTQKDTDELLAIGVYTDYRQGNKAVGYTATTEKYLRDLGIKGLRDIIKLDINASDKYFWTACSGAIEHMWQINGGKMIPTLFIDEYFDVDKIKIDLISDGFHFWIYDKDDERYKKVIFGYNSKSVFDKIHKTLENKIFSSLEHSEINEKYSDDKYVEELQRKLAVYIDYVEFDGYKELPKSVIDYFKNLIDECDIFIENNPNYEYTDNTFKHNLEVCKESIEEVTELVCNEMKI